MSFVADLWLPILLSGVLVFLASSVIHMVLPLHKEDMGKLPGEGAIMDAIRAQKVPPGPYVFPYASSMKEMGSPEMIARFEQGPVGLLTIKPAGPPAMGPALALWFLYALVIAFFAGYIGWVALEPGAPYLRVFRVVGTAAILGFGFGEFSNSIWRGQPWSVTFKYLVDGCVYGLLTAGAFAWLWP